MTAALLALILMFQAAPAGQTAQPGVVTGQLRTVDGNPAIGIWIGAMPLPTGTAVPADGPQYYSPTVTASETLTDNQGRYRLTNIPPGRYYIMAGVVGDATYYPAAANATTATVLTVGPGSSTPNIDFKLLRPFGRKVSGVVKPNPNNREVRATLFGGRLEEVLRVQLGPDGSFDFGHVPPGNYLLGLFPQPAGLASMSVKIADADVSGLELVIPPTHMVTGKIVVENGPLPHALLEFNSLQNYIVGASINPDGTFTARLHAARHRVDLAGMPVGWYVSSVRVGTADAMQGFVVGNSDVSGVVITVAAPARLPRIRGKITGLPEARLASTKVEVSGPINGSLSASVRPDGTFEFPAVMPGLYQLKLSQVSAFSPREITVAGWDTTEVQVTVR